MENYIIKFTYENKLTRKARVSLAKQSARVCIIHVKRVEQRVSICMSDGLFAFVLSNICKVKILFLASNFFPRITYTENFKAQAADHHRHAYHLGHYYEVE